MEKIRKTYQELKDKHSADYQKLSKQSNFLGIWRFVLIVLLITSLVVFIKTRSNIYLYCTFAAAIGFFVLVKIHNKLSFRRKLSKTLIKINKDELDYLNGEIIPFKDGSEYIDHKHAYTFDLDFFGKDSLFQNINRTASYIGSEKLAGLLQSHLQKDEIIKNQKAVNELSGKLELRQKINAIATIADDNRDIYEKLIDWVRSDHRKASSLLKVFSYVSPVVFLLLLGLFIVEGSPVFKTSAIALFFINITVLFGKLKAIKREIITGTKIDEIMKNYSLIIKSIETENFQSDKLNNLQARLTSNSFLASQQIQKLSSLFSQLDSLFNLIGAAITNGVALYHIHVFRNILKWKDDHKKHVVDWLEVVGEIEALGSLANFSHNNPSFSFPELNDEGKIVINDLGHPLIDEGTRVNNDVEFIEQKYIILTGSNMSGKSTFLRSLGLNMVLAGIGSAICASKANINPLKVWVSMRLSDSLEENESYFFAEVKRLKEIMEHAEKEQSFVLLDEILRGTNSDDKHLGTVEVIKKLVAKGAVGAIATHDLKVCLTTDEYPESLVNKCFEVEIINNELSFDFKLRDGICKNKSATFLMEKMGVI